MPTGQPLWLVRPLRSLSQVHMCLPYSLPSRHPDCGFQEGASLAIFSPPAEASIRTLSRPLFIQAGRLTWWNRWSPRSLVLLSSRETTPICDFVSQQRSGDEPPRAAHPKLWAVAEAFPRPLVGSIA